MTRPQRQIDDQANILTDPTIHALARPSWTCEAGCGDWPCPPIRRHMHETMPAVEISMVMSGYRRDLKRERDLTQIEAYDRLFGWIVGPTPAQPSGWHPPGGPW